MQNFANALVRKGDEDDASAIVTKALDELKTSVETRIAAVETKAAANDNSKLVERLDKLETKLNRPAVLKGENDNEPTAERKAFVNYLRSGREAMDATEVKSLRVADGTSGGFLATSEFVAEVIKGIVEMSPIRQAARVGSTASGNVILPKRTGRPTGYWVGETAARTETGSTYGQVDISTHEMATYVDVSQRLLEDAAVNIESEVAFDLAQEFARLEASAFMVGNGVGKPQGIMAHDDVAYSFTGNGSTLGSAPADLLIDAFYAVPA